MILRGSYTADAVDDWCFEGGEMTILVILGRFWSVWYPTDGGSAAFTIICHCGDGPESSIMISDQF